MSPGASKSVDSIDDRLSHKIPLPRREKVVEGDFLLSLIRALQGKGNASDKEVYIITTDGAHK